MPNYKAAFESASLDLSAIMSLLGFTNYPGIDPMLRAITNLTLAKAEAQTLRDQVQALQSDANSYQSGYDEGRRMGAKHRQSEVEQLTRDMEALRARVVVVPERMEYDNTLTGQSHRDNRRYVNGWNDALSRLNGKAVSEGLLRRIIQHMEWDGTQDQDITVMDYIRRGDLMTEELRALLDEGKEVGDD